MASNIIADIDLIVTYKKCVQKYKKLSLDSVNILQTIFWMPICAKTQLFKNFQKAIWLKILKGLWQCIFSDIMILSGQNIEKITGELVVWQWIRILDQTVPWIKKWRKPTHFLKQWSVFYNFLIRVTVWCQIAICHCTTLSQTIVSWFWPIKIKIYKKIIWS